MLDEPERWHRIVRGRRNVASPGVARPGKSAGRPSPYAVVRVRGRAVMVRGTVAPAAALAQVQRGLKPRQACGR
jgi:hypothetical protein